MTHERLHINKENPYIPMGLEANSDDYCIDDLAEARESALQLLHYEYSSRAKSAPVAYDTPSDLLDLYYNQLKQYPLLTVDEEKQLAAHVKEGVLIEEVLSSDIIIGADEEEALYQFVKIGREAAHTMTCANLRLVISIAYKFTKRAKKLGLNELIQEGNVGLMRAVKKFDVDKGFKFSTYATWWIRQSIQRALADKDQTIRVPTHQHTNLVKMRAARNRLRQEHEHEPTVSDLAEATGIKEETIQRLQEVEGVVDVSSLNKTIGDNSDSTEFGDFIADTTDVAEDALKSLQHQDLEVLFKKARCNEREVFILQRRYGLNGEGTQTLDAVGAQLGLTRERIRQLEARALGKLRRLAYRTAIEEDT